MTEKYNKLTKKEEKVIIHKGTEMPFSGKYYKHTKKGIYVCKRCNAPLFKSDNKFESNCGWPSFDSEIPSSVEKVSDADGLRTEIICKNCKGHLGHVFEGEGFTKKNTRLCVNSISLNFTPNIEDEKIQKAYFAGGCFWGVEYYFQKIEGVISTKVGYMGGNKKNPTYKEVCRGGTGHVETLEVIYDSSITNFEKLAQLFFEIHDPTQANGQGPDIGSQYRSVVFYENDEQRKITEKLIEILKNNGYNVVTKLVKAGKFWEAEKYHQKYYLNNGQQPYCHIRKKRF